jgi:hypothetical protein
MALFQTCSYVLKEDIIKVFREFQDRDKFERSLNATFIALIPKIVGVDDPKDFRSISPVSDILANRLKMVYMIVSKSQNSFIRDRKILDHVLITNECLNSRLRSREFGVLCKLNLEKAYNHVNWDFLLYILRLCGFGRKWCSWIAHCILTMLFSILVNNTSTDLLVTLVALKQWDSLSPLLFVIVMEA